MGAPKGNQYALGNAGGRPPIYDSENKEDIEKVEKLCEEYFDKLIELPISKPPTVTGLTLYLGFADKSTLYDYAKKKEFSHPIKKALTVIEQYHEELVAEGEKCTGNIFVLKNFGWFDNVKQDITSGGDKIQPNTTIVIEKPINE